MWQLVSGCSLTAEGLLQDVNPTQPQSIFWSVVGLDTEQGVNSESKDRCGMYAHTHTQTEEVSHTCCQRPVHTCLCILLIWTDIFAVLNSWLVIHANCSLSASVSRTHTLTHLQTVTKQQCLLEQGPLRIPRHRQALFTQCMLSWARLSQAVTRLTDRWRDRWSWRNRWILSHSPRWETSSMHHHTCLIQLLPWLVKWIMLVNQSHPEWLPVKSFQASPFLLCHAAEMLQCRDFGWVLELSQTTWMRLSLSQRGLK